MKNYTLTMRLKLLLGSLCILIVAQAFNGGLSLSSLEKLYSESLISSFSVVGNDFLIKLQSAVRFGKSLEKFYGIGKALEDAKKDLPELDNIFVALPDGTIVQSMRPEQQNESMEKLLGIDPQKALKDIDKDTGYGVQRSPGQRHLLFTLTGKDGELAGFVVYSFPESLIRKRIEHVLLDNAKILIQATCAAALLLSLGLWLLPITRTRSSRIKLYLLLILAVGAAQIFYSVSNVRMFREQYIVMARDKAESLTSLVGRDIEFLLNKGVRINKLRKIEDRFGTIIRATPEIKYIEVLSPDFAVLNRADREGLVTVEGTKMADLPFDGYYDVLLPMAETKEGGKRVTAGFIHVLLDKPLIQKKVEEIFFDSLTVTLISLLFVVELLIFLMLFIRKAVVRDETLISMADMSLIYMLGRPAAFGLVFMWAIPGSFLPLFMQKLYEPLFGMPKDVVLGLPISLEMFAALFAALIAGVVSDRRGWHLPFISGLLLCAAGAFGCGMSTTGLQYILFRGLTGLGYGLAWMAIQSYIFRFTTPTSRAQGISNLVAGIVSGQICGTAVGAMLAERIGYSQVFLVSAALAALPLAFTLFFMRQYMTRPEQAGGKADHFSAADLKGLLFNRNYASILMLSLVPFALCQVGLLMYAAPIYLNQIGASQSSIGRVLMIYGLSVIYIAPWISKFVDRTEGKKWFIVLGGLVGGGGLMSLYFYSGFLAVMVAVFLMGISGSLVGSAQSALALKLNVIQRVGVGKAMSVQRAADKLGQMLGPLVLGSVIASVGINNGVALVGLLFFVSTFLFLLVVQDSPKPESEKLPIENKK